MTGEVREMWLPADRRSAALARAAIREIAAGTRLGPVETYDVTLAVSEAVTNAVEHGSPRPDDTVRLRVSSTATAITVEVRDRGRFPAHPKGDADERGRGLPIIGMLSDRVELEPGPDGTVLRFAKRLSNAS